MTKVQRPRSRKPDDAFERARTAVAHVGKRTFADWLSIGIAVTRADFEAKKENSLIDYQAARRRLASEKIVPPVGTVNVAHLRRIMRHYDEVVAWYNALPVENQIEWSAPATILKYCPLFAVGKLPKMTSLETALKVLNEALEKMDEPQRRLLGNSIFHRHRLLVTHPHDPERSSIDQLADDLADRLRTAHQTTRARVLPRFIKMARKPKL